MSANSSQPRRRRNQAGTDTGTAAAGANPGLPSAASTSGAAAAHNHAASNVLPLMAPTLLPPPPVQILPLHPPGAAAWASPPDPDMVPAPIPPPSPYLDPTQGQGLQGHGPSSWVHSHQPGLAGFDPNFTFASHRTFNPPPNSTPQPYIPPYGPVSLLPEYQVLTAAGAVLNPSTIPHGAYPIGAHPSVPGVPHDQPQIHFGGAGQGQGVPQNTFATAFQAQPISLSNPPPGSSSSQQHAAAEPGPPVLTSGHVATKRALDQVRDNAEELAARPPKRPKTAVTEMYCRSDQIETAAGEPLRVHVCVLCEGKCKSPTNLGRVSKSYVLESNKKNGAAPSRMYGHILGDCIGLPDEYAAAEELKSRRGYHKHKQEQKNGKSACPPRAVSATEIDALVIDWATSQGIPFHAFDHHAIQSAFARVQVLARETTINYQLPHRTKLTERLSVIVRKRKAVVRKMMHEAAGRIQIGFDGWHNGVKRESFLGLGVSFMTRNWVRVYLPTDFTTEIGKDQYAIAEQVLGIISAHGLDGDKIAGCVVDNVAVNGAALRHIARRLGRSKTGLMGMHERCGAHTLQRFAVHILDLPMVRVVRRKVRGALSYVNCATSGIRFEDFKQVVMAVYGGLIPEKVPQAGDTRWGGENEQFKYTLRYRNAFPVYAESHPDCEKHLLTQDEFDLLSLLIDVLSPLEKFTVMLQDPAAASKFALGFTYLYVKICTAFGRRELLEYLATADALEPVPAIIPDVDPDAIGAAVSSAPFLLPPHSLDAEDAGGAAVAGGAEFDVDGEAGFERVLADGVTLNMVPAGENEQDLTALLRSIVDDPVDEEDGVQDEEFVEEDDSHASADQELQGAPRQAQQASTGFAFMAPDDITFDSQTSAFPLPIAPPPPALRAQPTSAQSHANASSRSAPTAPVPPSGSAVQSTAEDIRALESWSTAAREVALQMHSTWMQYQGLLSPVIWIAHMVDPRFRLRLAKLGDSLKIPPILFGKIQERAHDLTIDMMIKLATPTAGSAESTSAPMAPPPTPTPAPPSTLPTIASDDLAALLDSEPDIIPQPPPETPAQVDPLSRETMAKELKHYLAWPHSPRKREVQETGLDTALDWWREHGHEFPNLKRVAATYLGIPLTVVDQERFYSRAGRAMNKWANRIGSEKFGNLVLNGAWARSAYADLSGLFAELREVAFDD